MSRPVAASQTLAIGTFQSRSPVTRVLPSGENASGEAPSITAICSQRATSQIFTLGKPGLTLSERSGERTGTPNSAQPPFDTTTCIGRRSALSWKANRLPSAESVKCPASSTASLTCGNTALSSPVATSQILRS